MARRGRPLAVEWAAGDDAASLQARYRREHRADVRPRLHGRWLVRAGRSAREAAAVLGVHERTVTRWLGWYPAGGLAAVEGRHAGGKGAPSFLTAEQRAELAAEVATGRFRTGAEIRAWVAERWGVRYAEGGMYALLTRLRCAPKVPRPVHEKADTAAQARWKKGLAAGLAAAGLTVASRVGYADEQRIGLRGTTRRVWGRRGTKVRQRLQLRYEWASLFAAVDARSGTIWWDWVDTMKAVDLRPVIAEVRARDLLDALVWDGAPSHADANVRAVGLPLVALPPYSLELNPAERLFEEVRRRVEGTVYATLADKVDAVEAFLRELDADPARVRSLCGWDWLTNAHDALPALIDKAA